MYKFKILLFAILFASGEVVCVQSFYVPSSYRQGAAAFFAGGCFALAYKHGYQACLHKHATENKLNNTQRYGMAKLCTVSLLAGALTWYSLKST